MHLGLEFNSATFWSYYTCCELFLLLILLYWFNWLLDDIQMRHIKLHCFLHHIFSWNNYHMILFDIVVKLQSINVLFILSSNLASREYALLMSTPFDSLRFRIWLRLRLGLSWRSFILQLLPKLQRLHKCIVTYLYISNLIIYVDRWSHFLRWSYVRMSDKCIKDIWWFWETCVGQ